MRLWKSRLLTMLAVAGLLAACSSGAAPGTTAAPATTTTAVAPTTTTTAPETTTTTAPTTTTTAPPEEAELRIASFIPTVTMTAPAGWAVVEDPSIVGPTMFIDVGLGRYLVISSDGPQTSEEWLESLQSLELELGEVTPTEVGGASGLAVTARIGENAVAQGCMDQKPCVPLNTNWIVVEGAPNRIWVVDVDGKAIMIVTEDTEGGFDNWVEQVEQVLATLTWG